MTLERVRDLLRQGHEVRVVEQATGEDITSVTLHQILLDMGRQRNGGVPEPVLVDLVKDRGEQLFGVVRAGLNLPRQVRERAAGGIGGAASRTTQTVDEVVAGALHNLNIATAEEFVALEQRVDRLAEEVEALRRALSQQTRTQSRRKGS